jgi:hypothetical protein
VATLSYPFKDLFVRNPPNRRNASELASVLPAGANPALYRFVTTKINQGVPKTQIFSASPTFVQWIQSYGWTTYASGASWFAFKSFNNTGSQVVDLSPFIGAKIYEKIVKYHMQMKNYIAGENNEEGGLRESKRVTFKSNFSDYEWDLMYYFSEYCDNMLLE